MEDVERTNICTYMYSVACSISSELFMIFGYINNAWLIVYRPDSSEQFQRGLNDDCFKEDDIHCLPWSSLSSNCSGFPKPFDTISSPNAVMYLALYFARFLLISGFLWILFCMVCCCNLSAERFARKHRRYFMQFCSLVALCFVILSILILTAYYTDAIMRPPAPFYERMSGSGFWLFFGGGMAFYLFSVFSMYEQEISTCLSRRQTHEPLPRHELATLQS